MASTRGLVAVLAIALTGCLQPEISKISLAGEAQGTTYNIAYMATEEMDGLKSGIDSVLNVMDQSLSTYINQSLISRYNRGEDSNLIAFEDEHFFSVLEQAHEVYEGTEGYFDPSIAPLVNYWGWGPGKKLERKDYDRGVIDSLCALVGLEAVYNVYMEKDGREDIMLGNINKGMQLDFNAIAQGYSVDVLHDYMLHRGIHDFLIELGGEIRTSGSKAGEPWVIGIDKPLPNQPNRELYALVELTNKALATSGNYRKFYELDGKRFAHTIDPTTGFPVTHNLLSATVIAEQCAIADAYATAFMVMGTDAVISFLEKNSKGLAVMLIYENEERQLDTWQSPGFQMKLLEEDKN